MSLSQGRAQEEGLGSGTAPVLLPPPVPQHSPAVGMAPGLPGAHGHSPSPQQGSPNPKQGPEGQKHPDAWVTRVPQFPQQTARPHSSSGQPQVMHKGVWCSSFGDPNPPSSTPQSPVTQVPTTRPHTARLLPALVWGLINFGGKRGALRGGSAPTRGCSSAARVLSISKHRGLGISHSPTLRLCAPRAKPLSQPPPPRALNCAGESGGDPKSLPALPQGGKPPAHRCHRPRVAGREPLLWDGEKLWRVLAASRDVGRGGRPSSFPSQPSSGPPFAAGRNVQPVPSTDSSSSPRSWHHATPPSLSLPSPG